MPFQAHPPLHRSPLFLVVGALSLACTAVAVVAMTGVRPPCSTPTAHAAGRMHIALVATCAAPAATPAAWSGHTAPAPHRMPTPARQFERALATVPARQAPSTPRTRHIPQGDAHAQQQP